MNKKGIQILSEQMFALFEIIAVALTVFFFVRYIYGFAGGDFLERAWLTNDLALLIDSASSSPGVLAYDYSLPKFQVLKNESIKLIEVKEAVVKAVFRVEDSDKDTEIEVRHSFSKKKNFISNTNKTEFQILVHGDQIEVRNIAKVDLKQLDCLEHKKYEVSRKNQRTIIFGGGNQSFIGNLTRAFKGQPGFEVKETGTSDIYIYFDCTGNQILISKPNKESKKFACILAEQGLGFNYNAIMQKPDSNLDVDSNVAVRISFDCDPKKIRPLISAIGELYG